MIQKTYHIENITNEKLEAVLLEVGAMPAYREAAQVLMLVFEQNWDRTKDKVNAKMAKALLPKAEIVGITHIDQPLSKVDEDSGVLTFLMFENVSFSIAKIDMSGKTDEAVRDELEGWLASQGILSTAKGILALFQKVAGPMSVNGDILWRDVEVIFEKAKGIPVFGADAARSGASEDSKIGYVFDGEGTYMETLLCVVFHGETLHIKATSLFGWTPVGKTMTITSLQNPYTVNEIDGKPAAEIYEKYIGLPYRTNSLSLLNICEFPITVVKDGFHFGRLPYAWTKDGKLRFTAAFREGEQIRLSYGIPQQILSEVNENAAEFHSFEAEGLLMIVCLNRLIFLKDSEQMEIDAYRSVAKDVAYLRGNSEIFLANGTGGEMHSALVAIGFREGEPQSSDHAVSYAKAQDIGDEVIPLELRLMTFMRSVTLDLEQTTEELLRLKEHLEDEVEIKTRENESLSLHVVQTLAEAIDAKDTYTNGHSSRVAKYSRAIAKRAGYSEKDQNEIFMMGLLHDVGKIGVPDAVINKPGKLTEEEFERIKNHPVMGARILKTIKEMPKLVTGARWHHERYDGRGYPDGLKGLEIPEEARIIAVADAYDAMTSNRSYRRGMSQGVVREQIEKGKGTQFDPRFADIMLSMIDEDTAFDMREK